MEQQWIEHLRKRFADRKVAPPDGLWESVEAAMNNGVGGEAKSVKRRGRAVVVPMWGRRAGAVAACAAVLAVTVWYFSGRNVVHHGVVGGIPDAGAPVGRLAKASVQVEAAGGLPAVPAVARRVVACAASRDTVANDVAQPSVYGDAAVVDVVSDGESVSEEARNTGGKSVVVSRTPPRDVPHGGGGAGLLVSSGRNVVDGGGVSVSLYGAGFASIGASTGNTGASFRPYNLQQDEVVGSDIMLLSAAADRREAGEVRVRHRHPVKVGASVRFNLAGRFGMETGLNYSYHSADIASGDDSGGYTTKQKLHFVGVPLAVSYDIWHTDFLDVYASAGGAVEFCVSGKSHTEYVSGGKVVSTAGADVRDERPQWSVGASAGVQYNVNNVVGVYVEPGVSYYFDNGSGVNTVYKDKPLNFNLNVGLRFTIR